MSSIDEEMINKLVDLSLERLREIIKTLKVKKRGTPLVSVIIPSVVGICDICEKDIPPYYRYGAGLATLVGMVSNSLLSRLGMVIIEKDKISEDLWEFDKLANSIANIDIVIRTSRLVEDESEDDIDKMVNDALDAALGEC